jgi:hypothetical protein
LTDKIPQALQTETMPAPQLEIAPAMPEEKTPKKPISGGGLLLGIRPKEERGTILGTSAYQAPMRKQPGVNVLRIAEFILAALAVFIGFIGFRSGKRQKPY